MSSDCHATVYIPHDDGKKIVAAFHLEDNRNFELWFEFDEVIEHSIGKRPFRCYKRGREWQLTSDWFGQFDWDIEEARDAWTQLVDYGFEEVMPY